MGGLLGFDLAPGSPDPSKGWCGWAHIDQVITAGAFKLEAEAEDLGALAANLEQHASLLVERFQPVHLAYEAPILRRWDSLIDLRRIYGLGMMLEYFAVARGLSCSEVDNQRVKAIMTGDSRAKKPAVASAAESLGVTLPKTKTQGREDAGDAVGVALEAGRSFMPHLADPHLAKLRGRLL